VRLLARVPDAARSEDIGAYDTLVCVGQGASGARCLPLAARLAEKLGGALAATRAVADAGLLPASRQVGQTGRAVSPKRYIAVGVSGAAQHMAGVQASQLIAVNTDPDAPIFGYADVGLVMDAEAFLETVLAGL